MYNNSYKTLRQSHGMLISDFESFKEMNIQILIVTARGPQIQYNIIQNKITKKRRMEGMENKN